MKLLSVISRSTAQSLERALAFLERRQSPKFTQSDYANKGQHPEFYL